MATNVDSVEQPSLPDGWGGIGLGCMRLSSPDVDEATAISVVHAALDGGVRVLDTANVYAPDDRSIGHNESLVAKALSTWTGPTGEVLVATKGGLVRGTQPWRPDGRAKHLGAACEASLDALGLERIPLYLLHTRDPRTSLATSARALAALKRDGLIERAGVSNLNLHEIRQVAEHVEIEAVQVELSFLVDAPIRNGVFEWCVERGVPLMAHTPLGGPRRLKRTASDPTLEAIAKRHATDPLQVALAWLRDLSHIVVPIPGSTRPETARAIGTAGAIELTDNDRDELLASYPAGRIAKVPRAARRPTADADGEVALVMGIPGAGKSTLAAELQSRGYVRLNRDARGGLLRDLVPVLDQELGAGNRRVVLDNTYPGRAERNRVIETAWSHGVPVTCTWLQTSAADAQINAALRMLARFGRLPPPESIREAARHDTAALAPSALSRYERQLEPPLVEEGFADLRLEAFERTWDDRYSKPALFFEYDGFVRRSRSGARTPLELGDLEIDDEAAARLAEARDAGYGLYGICWYPEVAQGTLSEETARELLDETNRRIGVTVRPSYCPHPPGPTVCWCRKPMPGLILGFVHRHGLDPASSLFVGPGRADVTLAENLGMTYLSPADARTGGLPPPPLADQPPA